jgi:hypothetical protein
MTAALWFAGGVTLGANSVLAWMWLSLRRENRRAARRQGLYPWWRDTR